MSEDQYYTQPAIGSWLWGAGKHTGHKVTQIENWTPRISGAVVTFQDGETEPMNDATVEFVDGQWSKIVTADGSEIKFDGRRVRVEFGVLTCGRVRCTCNEEWTVGWWPRELGEIVAVA